MAPAPPEAPGGPQPDPMRGVFETLLVRAGTAQFPAAHLERLNGSVSDLYSAKLPTDLADQLRQRAGSLQGEQRLRVDAVPEGGGRLRIELRSAPLVVAAGSPVSCRPAVVPGGIGRHKWSDRRWLDGLSAADGVPLILDRDGSVLEAAWANVWLIEGCSLLTPPADGRLLPGVMRSRLFELAAELGFEAREAEISLERLRVAEATLLTSSLRHAVPARIEGGRERYDGSHAEGGPIVDRIRAALSGPKPD